MTTAAAKAVLAPPSAAQDGGSSLYSLLFAIMKQKILIIIISVPWSSLNTTHNTQWEGRRPSAVRHFIDMPMTRDRVVT